MNHEQIEQEISIIRDMIEKMRKDTSRFGHFLIFMGVTALVFILFLVLLELTHRFEWMMPVMFGMTVLSGFIGSLIVKKSLKTDKVTAYPKTIFINLWVACSMALLLIAFVFPLIKTDSYNPGGSSISLILGIAIYMTGIICELPSILFASLTWPTAALLMTALPKRYHLSIILAAIILGWILPGILINRAAKKRNDKDAIPSHS